MYAITTELYLIGLMNFHWLRKVFYLQRGQVLGRTLYNLYLLPPLELFLFFTSRPVLSMLPRCEDAVALPAGSRSTASRFPPQVERPASRHKLDMTQRQQSPPTGASIVQALERLQEAGSRADRARPAGLEAALPLDSSGAPPSSPKADEPPVLQLATERSDLAPPANQKWPVSQPSVTLVKPGKLQ
jgi:hypothetical protein